MEDIEAKIKEIEDEIRRTQFNKATEHHIGRLKGRISKLKQEMIARAKKEAAHSRLSVKKHGDATVVIVGFPSVGKSTLLNAITDAESKVAAYEFTTLTAIPGMMNYKSAEVQIIDLPGIIEEASIGKGMGREILGYVRMADLVIVLLDVKRPEHYDIIKNELYNAGIRLDAKPPRVKITKRDRGGTKIDSSIKLTKMNLADAYKLCRSYGLYNADVIIHDNLTLEEFEDVLIGTRHYCQSLHVVNKCDIATAEDWKKVNAVIKDYVKISAEKEIGLEELKEEIFSRLSLIRIYTDATDIPIIIKVNSTVRDVAKKIHKDLVRKFKHAKITGKSVKFTGQTVGLDHVLKDNDKIRIIKR